MGQKEYQNGLTFLFYFGLLRLLHIKALVRLIGISDVITKNKKRKQNKKYEIILSKETFSVP